MKKMYTEPKMTVSPIEAVSVLMTSGDGPSGAPRITGIVHSEGNSGNVASAF